MKIYGVFLSDPFAYVEAFYQIKGLFMEKGEADKFLNEILKNVPEGEKCDYYVEEYEVL